MSDCIVKGCFSSTKKGKSNPAVSLHVFPKTPKLIKTWLQQTGQYVGNLDNKVKHVLETNKYHKYRMCSIHFTEDSYYTHGVKKYLRLDAIPSLFPHNSLYPTAPPTSAEHLPSTSGSQTNFLPTKKIVISLNDGQPFEQVFQLGAKSTQTTPRVSQQQTTCHVCGHHIYKSYQDASTNTEPPEISDKSTDFDPFYGTLTCQNQTGSMLGMRNASSTTKGLVKMVDAYSWTGVVTKYWDFSSEQSEDFLQPGDTIIEHQEKKGIGTQDRNLMKKRLRSRSKRSSKHQSASAVEVQSVNTDPVSETLKMSTEITFQSNMVCGDSKILDSDCSAETAGYSMEEFSVLDDPPFQDYVKERKYIVFESCIDQLLKRTTCTSVKSCKSPLVKITKRVVGTMLMVSGECQQGHKCSLWQSQPCLSGFPVGNMLSCASILFSGNQFPMIKEMFSYLGVQFVDDSTYYKYQKQYLFPTIDMRWKEGKRSIIRSLHGKPITLYGEGQCDNPGYTGKFYTYTMLEEESKKIIDFKIIKVSKATSSVAMKAKAFRRCLNSILNDGLLVRIVATDRHVKIKKIMLEEYSEILHQFDIWNYSKSLRKKLLAVSKNKSCMDLTPWVPVIINHLWKSSMLCQGNEQLMSEIWRSILFHVVNIHSWKSGSLVMSCAHKPANDEELKKPPWLPQKSHTIHDLRSIVCSPQIESDMKNLTEFCHTGNIEVFHNLLLKYKVKGMHCKMDEMEARTKLAVLAHNSNVYGEQKRIRYTYGDLQFKPFFPKNKHEWQVRPTYDSMNMDHIFPMMTDVLKLVFWEMEHSWQSRISHLDPTCPRKY
ncbi:uncharacterized protein LOC128643172 [Bombina bombina]|uniref:uncharacterized protein LOC128643172 n=1 Tax=Bombina bombina TaxID=8345 RepID=UPI00235A781F|nr:uncharacterized protein LOC128643172 [Bombina bombina]